MTSVGLFAGRGDVILSMFIAFGGGIWLGYQLNTFTVWVKGKIKK